MHTFRPFLALSVFSLFLISCGKTPPATDPAGFSSSSSSETSIAETHNVVYSGRVRPAGISVYMEGTHRLELSDGRFILLESTVVDLNGYVGELAEVTGSIRPTVEAGGIVMRVEQIRLLESSSSSESSIESGVSSSVETSSAPPVSPAPPTPSSSSVSSVPPAPVAAVSSMASSAASKSSLPSTKSSVSSIASSVSASPDLSARTASMAKQNMAASNWTQAYCTAHIGFCVSIHRNWFFKSFGAAAQSLWHLEVSSAEMENIGDGPLTVDLLSGSVDSKGASDGEVRTSGDSVVGYKEWTDGQHFEVKAPAALKEAVQYMVEHLTPMEKSS